MNFSTEIIASELKVFESRFKASVESTVPLLDRIMKYVVKTKGKQLRPMFVLLSAKLTGEINDSTYRAASLVELLHTASLVHDDVVDESFERRGFFSVFALWKAKTSVLVGDYLLAKGMLLALDNDDFKILQILSRPVKLMSEGELWQMEKTRSLNIDEETYFKIITGKTASLLASACSAGAYSSTHDLEVAEKMRLFGENVGIAFQIKDDLFDYGKDDVGKPTGNDYTLSKASPALKKELIYIIKNQNRIREKIDFVVQAVEETGGITYTAAKMHEYRNKALEILRQFPENDVRQTLEDLVNYTTDRKK
jgi:octaprenyl-diphosphate synthase